MEGVGKFIKKLFLDAEAAILKPAAPWKKL